MNKKRRIYIISVIIVLGLVGVLTGCGDNASNDNAQDASSDGQPTSTAEKESSDQTSSTDSQSLVNYDNFLKIEMGSSYEDVVALLGEDGTEQSSSDVAGIKTQIYTWSGDGISNMNITLQNNKLISKTQMGLDENFQDISLEQYNKLQDGMSYDQVKDIMGEGQILSQSEMMGIDTVIYAWINKSGASANLTFQGDTLQMKAQFNLK